MAARRRGIAATMVKYGGGISAVRALPKAKGRRPAVIILHGVTASTTYERSHGEVGATGFVGLARTFFIEYGDRNAACAARNG